FSATKASNPAAVSLVSRLMTLSPLSRLVEALCHRPSQIARAGCQAFSPSYPSSRASLAQNVGFWAACQHQKKHIFVQRFLAHVFTRSTARCRATSFERGKVRDGIVSG